MTFFTKVKIFFGAHKVAVVAVCLAVTGAGYWQYTKNAASVANETRYVLTTVQKGTIIVSLTGSGQVSASNQVDLKPKASGDIVTLAMVNGQRVKAGAVIAQIDSTSARKAVRDAEANLQSAKLSLAKLVQPADALSRTQIQNSLDKANDAKRADQVSLTTSYDDGFTAVSTAFLELPNTITGLQNLLLTGSTALGNTGTWNIDFYASAANQFDAKALVYRDDAYTKYQTARAAYDSTFANYKNAGRFSSAAAIERLLAETSATAKNIAESAKSATDLIQFYKDVFTSRNITPVALADTHIATLNTYTGKMNTAISSLTNAQTSIKNTRANLVNDDRTIAETTASLAKLQAGANIIDLQSAQLSVTQRQNALIDVQQTLADYVVRAPFDGTIAKLNVKKTDTVSAGTSIATFITTQKIATVSLNEVDVAKVVVGQKVTLTFDAIDGLTIAGSVADIDAVGTVSQGVVTYGVTIGFDTQDERVKPGMSVSAAIITAVKQDVLTVPNSAVKTQGSMSNVQMFVPALDVSSGGSANTQGFTSTTLPQSQNVTVGVSNDAQTEIISGLKEGDQIVSRVIVASAVKPTTQTAPSLFGAPRGAGR